MANVLYDESCLGVIPGTFFVCGEDGEHYCSEACRVAGAFRCGAAVMGGLLGMFEQIRENEETRMWDEWDAACTEANRAADERFERARQRDRELLRFARDDD